LLRHIRSLHSSLHALESEVAEFSRGIKGHLRVVANASAIAEHLPADLAAFAKANPGIRISLEELTSLDVQGAVAEGRADAGIFVAPAREASLECQPYREGTLAILVQRGHALARRAGHGFDALLDHDIVGLHAGAAAQEQMLERATALGRTLNARMQVHGFDAIAQLVEAGLGVAVLPAVVAERFAKVFRVQPLKLNEDWAQRSYLLAVRRQPVLPPSLRRFVGALCPGGKASPGPAAKAPVRSRRP
jgi:DNA-binding transcriptional LysR family regulator